MIIDNNHLLPIMYHCILAGYAVSSYNQQPSAAGPTSTSGEGLSGIVVARIMDKRKKKKRRERKREIERIIDHVFVLLL